MTQAARGRSGWRIPLALALATALVASLSMIPRAQNAGRGAIQTPTGGRGPGAAPEANDPANANADLSPKAPVVALTPAEQAARFWLPPGYRMEPVLAEPVVEDPAQIAFDGNGRMFVVELRGYVQTPDGIDLIPPIGRISMHQDRDNDGTYEHHTVFVDKMVFPRFVLPFGADTILTMETNADEVWKYTDTNADGVADKKALFTTNFGRAGNMESQQASLFWAQLRACGSVRTGSQHHVGRADPDRRYPGRSARDSHAGWIAHLRDRRRRQRRLSRRSNAQGPARRLPVRRGSLADDPQAETGEDRRSDAIEERLHAVRVRSIA
jgi:hypothetical protein